MECLRDPNSDVRAIVMSHEQFVDIEAPHFKYLWNYIGIDQFYIVVEKFKRIYI